MKDFTKEEALEIQKENLKEWETVLNDNTFQKLNWWCEMHNEKATTGEEIKRGQDLTDWIRTHANFVYNKKKSFL